MLLLSFALASPPPPPIVNGSATDNYPQAVMLRHATADWRTVYICTGTLIAPNWVLTAAHCLTDPEHEGLTELHVYMGSVWSNDASEQAADDWYPHPDYSVSDDGLDIVADLGGAEGEDMDAHEVVVIESNLVHDCTHSLSTHRDGINIKDRIGSVTVAGNVIFATHWGIELASPAIVRGNLVFGTSSNGIHATDEWGLGLSGLLIEDNVVIDARDAGIYMNAANNTWSDVTISRFTVIGADEAAIEAGGEGGIGGVIDDVLLANSAVGLDAWAPMELELGECTVHGNDMAGDREFADLAQDCVNDDPMFGDLSAPAGPDGRFFTDDDPWISASGGARPVSR